ncbi:type II secretion system protein GspD, partial [Verrucomicrobiota bacterium]
IEASAANNALLVDAAKGDFEEVRRLVEQLDKAVDQVFIEVIIAEVSDSDSFEWGVDMNIMDKSGEDIVIGGMTLADGGSTLLNMVQNGISPRGLTAGLARSASRDASGNLVTDALSVLSIDALKRTGKFRIRSNPSLVTQNNREANVSIVNDIPILKSKVEGTGNSREVIQNIERMEVGIKLKLTPHIVSDKEVRLSLNPSIEAVIDQGPAGTDFAPTIARREVSTTVTVPDGQTVVIAGLTQRDKRKVVRRVPILGWIPLIGLLFRDTYEVMEKTNVLIFVTPRILKDAGAAEKLKAELEEKTRLSASEKENGKE